jgi:hypothetical protein
MRGSRSQSPSSVASSKRIDQLAAAFSAFRRSQGAGRRIPMGLRRQFLAALDAGEPAGALRVACGVSWTQTRSWRGTAGTGSTPVTTAPQVLSVVDRQTPPACSPSQKDAFELRFGAWRISIQRVTE